MDGGHYDCVRLLLEAHCNVNELTNVRKTIKAWCMVKALDSKGLVDSKNEEILLFVLFYDMLVFLCFIIFHTKLLSSDFIVDWSFFQSLDIFFCVCQLAGSLNYRARFFLALGFIIFSFRMV